MPRQGSKFDGLKAALEALQGLNESRREQILSEISKKDPALGKKLKEGIFEFHDLQYILKSDFQTLWWEVPREKWRLALRKTQPGVLIMVEKFLSKRAFQEFKNDMDQKGAQPLRQVIQAQKEILDTARSLAAEGRIALPNKKKNDPLV